MLEVREMVCGYGGVTALRGISLDVKAGQRLVDDCVHPEQRAAIEAARASSAPAGGGLGITPSAQ